MQEKKESPEAPHGAWSPIVYNITQLNPNDEWTSQTHWFNPQEEGLHYVEVNLECNFNDRIILYHSNTQVDSGFRARYGFQFNVFPLLPWIEAVVTILGLIFAGVGVYYKYFRSKKKR